MNIRRHGPTLWWGYIHRNGSLHVKRFFDREDITEAQESPFVSRVFGPWEVQGREQALKCLRKDAGIEERWE